MVVPNKNSSESKKTQVANMFNNIAPKYDFLNHTLSVGIDKKWRKNVISLLKINPTIKTILDVATGTGDLAIAAASVNPTKIIGIDISSNMLEIGKQKIKEKKLSNIIELELGDAENMRFTDNSFDAVTVAFGVRNFENLQQGLSELHRVLKTNGICLILEFSSPQTKISKKFYQYYFASLFPFIGRFISKDKNAYSYLPDSISAFPVGKNFILELEKVGFKNCRSNKQTMGIATIYYAEK